MQHPPSGKPTIIKLGQLGSGTPVPASGIVGGAASKPPPPVSKHIPTALMPHVSCGVQHAVGPKGLGGQTVPPQMMPPSGTPPDAPPEPPLPPVEPPEPPLVPPVAPEPPLPPDAPAPDVLESSPPHPTAMMRREALAQK